MHFLKLGLIDITNYMVLIQNIFVYGICGRGIEVVKLFTNIDNLTMVIIHFSLTLHTLFT